MADLIDKASDYSNDEYDWSLPFVTASGEESEYLYVPNGDGKFYDPEDLNRVLYSVKEGEFKWHDVDYKNYWRKNMANGFVEEFWDDQHCNS